MNCDRFLGLHPSDQTGMGATRRIAEPELAPDLFLRVGEVAFARPVAVQPFPRCSVSLRLDRERVKLVREPVRTGRVIEPVEVKSHFGSVSERQRAAGCVLEELVSESAAYHGRDAHARARDEWGQDGRCTADWHPRT